MNRRIVVAASERTVCAIGDDLPVGMDLRTVEAAASEATVLWRRQADRTAWVVDALERLDGVRWLHTDTTGVDRLPIERLSERRIRVTNARHAHAAAVSEWALGAIFLAAKGLHRTVRHSDAHRWSPSPGVLVSDRTVVILGLGSIGAKLAGDCAALGMTVVGVSRSGKTRSAVDRAYSADSDWEVELAGADFLVNCLPLTEHTRGLIGAQVLDKIPAHAWFINVGRGETVAEGHLAQLLRKRRLGGAVLDAVAREPLDRTSPLWGLPDVIVSPHQAGATDRSDGLTRELFMQEFVRYREGQNSACVVDLREGY